MVCKVQCDVERYEREERAREVLHGSRVYVVDSQQRMRTVELVLGWAGANVARFMTLTSAVAGLERADALAVHTSASCRDAVRTLKDKDPTVALVLFGGGPKAAASLERALACMGGALILDQPAARYELLESMAAAVIETRRLRQGPLECFSVGSNFEEPNSGVVRPQPDDWSSEKLRARICYWSNELRLSERESQVMRGAVRGLKNMEIADQLGLSVHAVKKYLQEVLMKLGLESRHEIAWLLERTPISRMS